MTLHLEIDTPQPGSVHLALGDSLRELPVEGEDFKKSLSGLVPGERVTAVYLSRDGERLDSLTVHPEFPRPEAAGWRFSGDTLWLSWKDPRAFSGSYRVERWQDGRWLVLGVTSVPQLAFPDSLPDSAVKLRVCGLFAGLQSDFLYFPVIPVSLPSVLELDYRFEDPRRVRFFWPPPSQQSGLHVWLRLQWSAGDTILYIREGDSFLFRRLVPGELLTCRFGYFRGSRTREVGAVNLLLPDPRRDFASLGNRRLACRELSAAAWNTFAGGGASTSRQTATGMSFMEAEEYVRWLNGIFSSWRFALPELSDYEELLSGENSPDPCFRGILGGVWEWTNDERSGQRLVFGGSDLYPAREVPPVQRWLAYPPAAHLPDVGLRLRVAPVSQN